MKRTTGELPLDKGINPAAKFIRDNELAQEIDSKTVLTSKGEQLLNGLRGVSSK
jgi:hypothetical protein